MNRYLRRHHGSLELRGGRIVLRGSVLVASRGSRSGDEVRLEGGLLRNLRNRDESGQRILISPLSQEFSQAFSSRETLEESS